MRGQSVARSLHRAVDGDRSDVGQTRDASDQATGRFARVQRSLDRVRITGRVHRVPPGSAELMNLQRHMEIAQAVGLSRPGHGDGGRSPRHRRPNFQPVHLQCAQGNRHGQADAATRGLPPRHAHDVDIVRSQAVDDDAPMHQFKRRPVECEIGDRRVVALRVAQRHVANPQRVRKAARQAGDPDRVAGQP